MKNNVAPFVFDIIPSNKDLLNGHGMWAYLCKFSGIPRETPVFYDAYYEKMRKRLIFSSKIL